MKKSSRTRSSRLAKKLKQIRETLELSQNQLLQELGFANELFRSNISQYERGERVPAPPILLSYARLANVDLEVLIDDDLDLPEETSTKLRRKSLSKRQAKQG